MFSPVAPRLISEGEEGRNGEKGGEWWLSSTSKPAMHDAGAVCLSASLSLHVWVWAWWA